MQLCVGCWLTKDVRCPSCQRSKIATLLCYFYRTKWLCCVDLAKWRRAANTKKLDMNYPNHKILQKTVRGPTRHTPVGTNIPDDLWLIRVWFMHKTEVLNTAFRSCSLLSCWSSSSSRSYFYLPWVNKKFSLWFENRNSWPRIASFRDIKNK